MLSGEIIKETNITRDTLRHYVGLGLLEPRKDPVNSYMIYTEQDVETINFIKSARKLGFSLKQIKNLERRMNEATCKHRSLLPELERQVKEVRQKIKDLKIIEKHLNNLVTEFSDKNCELSPSDLNI